MKQCIQALLEINYNPEKCVICQTQVFIFILVCICLEFCLITNNVWLSKCVYGVHIYQKYNLGHKNLKGKIYLQN